MRAEGSDATERRPGDWLGYRGQESASLKAGAEELDGSSAKP